MHQINLGIKTKANAYEKKWSISKKSPNERVKCTIINSKSKIKTMRLKCKMLRKLKENKVE
jgi:hypothetical protein